MEYKKGQVVKFVYGDTDEKRECVGIIFSRKEEKITFDSSGFGRLLADLPSLKEEKEDLKEDLEFSEVFYTIIYGNQKIKVLAKDVECEVDGVKLDHLIPI